MNCVEWLRNYLSAGASEYGGVKSTAKEKGFSKAELKEARKILNVKTWHQIDHDEVPYIDNWFWFLPEDDQ